MKLQESNHASVISQSFNLVFVKLPKDKWLINFIYKNIFLVFHLLLKQLKIKILKIYYIQNTM